MLSKRGLTSSYPDKGGSNGMVMLFFSFDPFIRYESVIPCGWWSDHFSSRTINECTYLRVNGCHGCGLDGRFDFSRMPNISDFGVTSLVKGALRVYSLEYPYPMCPDDCSYTCIRTKNARLRRPTYWQASNGRGVKNNLSSYRGEIIIKSVLIGSEDSKRRPISSASAEFP